MNILHIITGLEQGGAESSLYKLISSRVIPEENILVVSLMGSGVYKRPIEKLSVRVIKLNLHRPYKFVTTFHSNLKIIQRFNPDIIQSWMYHANFFAYFFRLFFASRAKISWNIRHSLLSYKSIKFKTLAVIYLSKFLSRHVHAIVFNSQASLEQHKNIGYSSNNAMVIPNGFLKHKESEISRLRNSGFDFLDAPHDAIFIGHIARFHPVKDHITFFKAAVLLLNHFDNLHIVSVGRGVDLTVYPLSNVVPKRYHSRINVLGEIENVFPVLSCFHVLCNSSLSEGMPNVVGESLSLGVPCVATNVGDTSLLFTDADFLFSPKDHQSLFRIVSGLINMDEENYHALSRRVKSYLDDNYSLESSSKKYLFLYKKILR